MDEGRQYRRPRAGASCCGQERLAPPRDIFPARRAADNPHVEYVDERDLNVYIDGSSLSSPRRGGVGILFITEGPDGHWLETPYGVAGFGGATNNQMELQACVEVLRGLARGQVPVDALATGSSSSGPTPSTWSMATSRPASVGRTRGG